MSAGDYSIGSNKWNGLSKVLEETSELNEVLAKIMGSGGDTEHWTGDLRLKLVDEIADVYAALIHFETFNLTEAETNIIAERTEMKVARFYKWHVSTRKDAK